MGIKKWSVSWFTLLALSLVGCQRSVSNNSALRIQLPSASELGKVSAFSSFPVGNKYCYGVSVTGPDINGYAGDSCAPKTGIVLGFAEAGSQLEVQVPKGHGRTVDVYVHIPASTSDPCPNMSGNLSGQRSKDTYLVGTKTGVDTVDAVTTVTVQATFPGMTNHLASQLSMPTSCFPTLAATPMFRIRSSAATVTDGSTIYLRGRVGSLSEAGVATGGSYVLKGKVQNF